jgi:hypothetical protein
MNLCRGDHVREKVKAEYIRPEQVFSPKRHWQLLYTLISGTEETEAVALGRWKGVPVIAMRWNGDSDNVLGNPQSRGLATWFRVPDRFVSSILVVLPPEELALARKFLNC